jgi:hypothetical protein
MDTGWDEYDRWRVWEVTDRAGNSVLVEAWDEEGAREEAWLSPGLYADTDADLTIEEVEQ